MEDGTKVILKRTETYTEEIPIARYFSTGPLNIDERNHCVQIIDIIPIPGIDTEAFLVMPYLADFEWPPFRNVSEVLEALHQFLQASFLDVSSCLAHVELREFNSCTSIM